MRRCTDARYQLPVVFVNAYRTAVKNAASLNVAQQQCIAVVARGTVVRINRELVAYRRSALIVTSVPLMTIGAPICVRKAAGR